MHDGENAGAPDEGAPVLCPSCGRPTDDIEAMDEGQLLDTIHLGLLRDLARTVRSGRATHQELAVARGLLRDNKRTVPDPSDPNLPEQSAKTPLPERRFPNYEHDE